MVFCVAAHLPVVRVVDGKTLAFMPRHMVAGLNFFERNIFRRAVRTCARATTAARAIAAAAALVR